MKETLTTIEKALFLKEQDVFSNVGVEQLADVAAVAEEVHYEAGTVIVQQDQPSEHFYIVVEGDVLAERDGIVTTVMNAGRGFGDLTLEPGARYSFTARAVTHTHVLRISIDDFVDVMLEHPEIAVGIVRALGLRLREAELQLAAIGRALQDGSGQHSTSEGSTERR